MSAKPGGSSEDRIPAKEPRISDGRMLARMPESYPAYLFDYCEGILRDSAAAADVVRDTLVAAESQAARLRDPGRLQAWLYSIGRRQCLRRLPHRRRTSRRAGSVVRQAYTSDAQTTQYQIPDAEAEAREQETVLVVAAALDVLRDRDQELLSLGYKHGLSDADVAATMGISAARARRLVARASRRFSKSAAVVVVLRRRWTGCEALEKIVGDTDRDFPRLTPRLRRRLTRHVGPCDTCTWNSGDMAFGPELLGAMPLAVPPGPLPLPAAIADLLAEDRSGRREIAARLGSLDKDGFPVQPDARRGMVRAVAASSSVALIVLVTVGIVLHQPSPRPASGRKATVAEVAPAPTAPSLAAASPSATPGRASRGRRRAPVRIHGTIQPFPAQSGPPPASPPPPPRKKPTPAPTKTPKPGPTGHKPSPSPPASPPPFSPSPSPTPSPPPSPSPFA